MSRGPVGRQCLRPWAVGVAVLLAWWLGHHAYRLAPVAVEGHAWNMAGALARMVLLAVIVRAYPHPLVGIPADWLGAEELQAVGCTAAYIVNPWPMQPGDEKCSAALGLPLNVVCLSAALWTGAWLLDKLKGRSP